MHLPPEQHKGGERERERERVIQTDRQTDRQTEREQNKTSLNVVFFRSSGYAIGDCNEDCILLCFKLSVAGCLHVLSNDTDSVTRESDSATSFPLHSLPV